MTARIAGLTLLAFCSTSALCALDSESHVAHSKTISVIYDSGKTVDAKTYYRKLDAKEAQAKSAFHSTRNLSVPKVRDEGPITQERLFPLVSKTLRPGEPIGITSPHIYRPFFIIGMDSGSIEWMRSNYEAFAERNAYGVVVEANDWQEWQLLKIEALKAGISLSILSGDALSGIYKITTYPVFVMGDL